MLTLIEKSILKIVCTARAIDIGISRLEIGQSISKIAIYTDFHRNPYEASLHH
jgi:hypothetical protein